VPVCVSVSEFDAESQRFPDTGTETGTGRGGRPSPSPYWI